MTTARAHDTEPPASWPTRAPGQDRSRPGRRGRGLAWAAVAVAVLGVAAVAVVLHRPATVHRSRQAAASSATPTSSATTATSSTAPTSSATAGWTTYRDPGGFSIKIPPGWAIHTRDATEVTFTGPQAGFVVLVGWTTGLCALTPVLRGLGAPTPATGGMAAVTIQRYTPEPLAVPDP